MFVITCATQEVLIFRNAKTREIVVGAENRVEQCHYAAVVTRIEEDLDDELTGGWKVVEVCASIVYFAGLYTHRVLVTDGTEIVSCVPVESRTARRKVPHCMRSLDSSILLSPLSCCQSTIYQHLIVVMSLQMHGCATFTRGYITVCNSQRQGENSKVIERGYGRALESRENMKVKHGPGRRRGSYESRAVGLFRFSFSRRDDQASSVAATSRCLIDPTLSSAGRTSREKTGEPSGSGGAE